MLRLNKLRILTNKCLNERSRYLHSFALNKLQTNGILISDEVRTGLIDNKAVVALESTIITHGMPYPNNVKCAIKVEEEIRKQGAIPATIGLLKGDIKVGLTIEEINRLGDVKSNQSLKISRRDLPYVISNRLYNGGTTVSGTILIASKVGIKIFATGGIGGVHRMGELTFDISADLTELGRNNVAVISSGVKSILDISKTLEYLETQGVFVSTYGDSNEFPAFYTRKSGCYVPYNFKTPKDVAQVIYNSHQIDLNSGQLIAVPIPIEYEMNRDIIDNAIEEALKDANKLCITGKEITPFLLKRIATVTDGKSLESNIALVMNNAKVAAEIAVELAKIENPIDEEYNKEHSNEPIRNATNQSKKRPFVMGGSVLDRCIAINEKDIKMDGRLHRGTFTESAGGVARNMCEVLCKLNNPPHFLTAIGKDSAGHFLRKSIDQQSTKLIQQSDDDTSQCAVILDNKGECKLLIGQMKVHDTITSQIVEDHEVFIKDSSLLITDANPSQGALDKALEIANRYNVPVFFEPTDVPCSIKPFKSKYYNAIKFISPNLLELKEIANFLGVINRTETFDTVQEVAKIARKLADYIDNIIVTMGAAGLLVARRNSAEEPLLSDRKTKDVQVRHYCAPDVLELVNVSGAGDCLAAGIIASMLQGYSEETSIAVGLDSARAALRSLSAVPKVFNDINWGKPAYYTTI